MTRREWLAGLLGVAGTGEMRQASATNEQVRLGSTMVSILSRSEGSAALTYVNVHENEITARTALNLWVQRTKARAVCLKAQRARLISFAFENRIFIFDPNRMFTARGIEQTLRFHGPYTPAAHDLIAGFAAKVVRALRTSEAQAIIALHNNFQGKYSIYSHLGDGANASEAERVKLGRPEAGHEFILANRASTFEYLSNAGLNVVLLNSRPPDDGSLSVYCHQHRLTYVNVEAPHGHLESQLGMLREVTASFQ